MALLSAGVLFAPASLAGDYTRWNLPEGALARLGKGNLVGSERQVAWSPDGRRLAVASTAGIWLYDAPTGAEIALLEDYRLHVYDDVLSMSFSPDSQTLASGRGATLFQPTTRIQLWDARTGFGPARTLLPKKK